ncbi:unnamed protein product [Musa acuminata var. zebrina]
MSNAEEKIEIITSEEWLSSLKKRVDETKWTDWRTVGPTIFKVPRIFQEADSKAYKPRMVSLGPYHHGKIHLKAMEDLKWHYLKKFLGRNPGMSLEDYIEKIKKTELEARMAYSEKVDMTSDEFAQMMLLDCCFVIEIIHSYHNPITSTRYTLPVVVRDMLMLENQLPFFLLQTLFNSAYPDQPDDLLKKQALKFFGETFMNTEMKLTSDSGGVDHLLHMIHFCITLPETNRDDGEPFVFCWPLQSMKRSRHQPKDDLEGTNRQTRQLKWIPSATQLTEAGVHFTKKDEATNFLDITFQNGEMKIPLLQVDDDTETLFRNLIAFEQCSINVSFHVTAYAALMDCVINTAADVALLQQHGIILSGLGDGKQVANLFNKLCKEVTLDYENSYVSGIYKDVNKHWTNKYNQWRARLNHDYFSNPWAVISVFAAILLFVLATTQTIYSALSYVRPPS